MKILVVEDEKRLGEALAQILKEKKYFVTLVNNGLDGLYQMESDLFDLVILDIMLPVINGLEVLKKARENNILTPVLMLTAKSELENKIEGLEAGADDYLTKPFEPKELLARVKAILRRNKNSYISELSYGNILLDKDNLYLNSNKKQIELTLKEASVLELLILNKEITLSKDQIIDKIWSEDLDISYNHVEVYISFLRKKLKHLNSNVSIKTIHGIGYRLEVKDV